MCNIAGYAGIDRAAPILLEMIRRQQDFDGCACTGIATIFEGRIYYRKISGTVDDLMKHTDAFYLPGTVGIAHTRPGGNAHSYNYAHPFVTADDTMAGMTNGTVPIPEYPEKTQRAATFLEEQGYKFRGEVFDFKDDYSPKLKNGSCLSCVDVRLNYTHYFYNQGMTMTAAMAKMASELYTDSVFGALNIDTPDRFYILRTTRPAATLKTERGIYVATTRFAFPDGTPGVVGQLPIFHPCEITKDGIRVSEDRMSGCEEVAEVTDELLGEAYARIVKLLLGKRSNPLYFDDLESAVNNMRDIFEGNHRLVQHARVVYDVLWRLKEEGKLRTERRLFEGNGIKKFRTYMWID